MEETEDKPISPCTAGQTECKSTLILAVPTSPSCSMPKSGEMSKTQIYTSDEEEDPIAFYSITEHVVPEVTKGTTKGSAQTISKTLNHLKWLEIDELINS